VPPRAAKRIAGRILRYLAVLVVVLCIGGATYQWLASVADAKRFPMPGERVDIGGRSLHLYCSGAGPTTVLLEVGLGGDYSQWRLVQRAIAPFARVCSYDRAGLGWSDPSDRATHANFVTEDLRRLVVAKDLTAPFVLVGWSAGGVFVRNYYAAYPDGVIGMVLVESSHEQQRDRLSGPDDAAKSLRDSLRALDLCRALAWSGAVRLSGAMEKIVAPLHLPDDPRDEIVALQNRTDYCAGNEREMRDFDADIAQTDPPRSLGDLPLVVLTRGMKSSAKNMPVPVSQDYLDRADKNWFVMQDELAMLSTRASHRVVPNSGHAIPLQAPDAVVAAVREVIDHRI
jgi:pimeloyl-ACP methyl ester carboxylesterase